MSIQKAISVNGLSKKFFRSITLITVVTIWLVACAPAVNPTVVATVTPVPTPQEIQTRVASREAQVRSVEIQIMDDDPPQVNALVRGNLTESCATLGESQVQYDSNTIRITVYAVSRSDIGCAQVTTPFETTIALDTNGLPDGTYTVVANGVSAVYVLPINTPTAIVPAPATTSFPAPTSSVCTDLAAFVSDVTIPDNTVIAANTAFTKTWRLKNTGTCTWDSNYLVAYISGATMSQQPGYWIVQQGQTVAPGQTVDVSVGMTAPTDNGSYASYWGLKKVDGQFIPIQGDANGSSFYIKIKINDGAAFGNITAQSISIEPEQGSGAVCTANSTYFVHVSITADGPIPTSYEISSIASQLATGYFQDANNNLSPYINDSVVFDQAGTRKIDYRFVGPYPDPSDITVKLRVNGGEWHNTRLSCQ